MATRDTAKKVTNDPGHAESVWDTANKKRFKK